MSLHHRSDKPATLQLGGKAAAAGPRTKPAPPPGAGHSASEGVTVVRMVAPQAPSAMVPGVQSAGKALTPIA